MRRFIYENLATNIRDWSLAYSFTLSVRPSVHQCVCMCVRYDSVPAERPHRSLKYLFGEQTPFSYMASTKIEDN